MHSVLMSLKILAMLAIPLLIFVPKTHAEDINGVHGRYSGENNDNIDMLNGTLSIYQNDFTLPGRNGLDVSIGRAYSSDITSDFAPTDDTGAGPHWDKIKPYGCFGRGWYYMPGRIYNNTIYYSDGSSEELFHAYPSDPRGRYKTRQYSLVTHHAVTYPDTTRDTMFCQNGSRVIYGSPYYNISGADGGYGGRFVTKVINATGDVITYEYYGNFPLIKRIVDAIGRSINFQYNMDSSSFMSNTNNIRLINISYLNHLGNTNTINYYYAGSNNNLAMVKYPSGDSIVYAYSDSIKYGANYQHYPSYPRLSQITLPYGGKVSYDWKVVRKYEYTVQDSARDSSAIVDTSEIQCITRFYQGQCQDSTAPCTCGYDYTNWYDDDHHYYSWNYAVANKVRIQLAGQADTTRFYYGVDSYRYNNSMQSVVFYPDSSINLYYHIYNSIPPGLDGWQENIFNKFEVIPYNAEASFGDTLFDELYTPSFLLKQWYIPSPETTNIKQTIIGIDTIDNKWIPHPGWPPSGHYETETLFVKVPVIYQSKTNNGGSFAISTVHRNFNVYTGQFSATVSNGVYDSTVIYRDTATNVSFPVYQKTIDSTGSGSVGVNTVRYLWDTTKVQLMEVRKLYTNDSLCTKITYDNYGNKSKIISPQNDTTFYYYDDSLSTFITRMKMKSADTTSAFDNLMRTEYYPLTGAKRYDISVNDDTTFYYYSAAGELDSVKRPMESGNWSSKTCYDKVNRIKTDSLRLDANQYSVTKSYFNEFYWPIKTETRINSGTSMVSDIQYDKMGRILRTNRPHTLASDTVWTKYFYDALGRKIIVQYPDGSRDSALYDSSFTIVIDKMGNRKKTILNNHLQVSKTVFGESYQDTIVYSYGHWNSKLTETDPAGFIKRYWYDSRERLYADSSGDEGKRIYYYDNANNLRLSRDATRTWKYIKYDKLGREIEMGMLDSSYVDTTQLNSATYPTTGATWQVKKRYDSYSSGFEPDSSQYDNPKGNLTEIEDGSGKTWFYYDNRNRIHYKNVYIAGLDTVTISYTYNSADQIKYLTYPNGYQQEYKYYDSGRLSAIPGFVYTSQQNNPGISYNPWGAIASITYFDSTTYSDIFSYDSTTSRLTKIYSHKGASKIWGQSYSYDTIGEITRNLGLNSDGSINMGDTLGSYTYNNYYYLTQAKVKSGAVTKTLKYGFNNTGNRIYSVIDADSLGYCYIDSVPQITYDYFDVTCEQDTVDTLSFVPQSGDSIDWACHFFTTYGGSFKIWSNDSIYVYRTFNDPGSANGTFAPINTNRLFLKIIGRESSTETDDGSVTDKHYGYTGITSNRLKKLSNQNRNNYLYDNAGRLIEDISGGKEYTYDAFGQLTKYTKDGNDRIWFTYDYAGHLVKKVVISGNLCDYPDSSISTTNICGIEPDTACYAINDSVAYVAGDVNNNGEFRGSDLTALVAFFKGTYNLVQPYSRSDANCDGTLSGADVTLIQRYFKGLGPRPQCCFWNCSTLTTTYYVYSGDDIIAEYNDTSLVSNYIYGLGQRIGRIGPNSADSSKQIYHNDHLGSVRAITNRSGSIITAIDYYPFGEQLQLTGSSSRFSFNGKEYDDSYGFDLYYYGARYMSPSLGRFVTPDPVHDFLNPYSYVGNNPMNRIDPTGMASLPAFQGPDWHWEDNRVDQMTSGPSVNEQIKGFTDPWERMSAEERLNESVLEAIYASIRMALNSKDKNEKQNFMNIAFTLATYQLTGRICVDDGTVLQNPLENSSVGDNVAGFRPDLDPATGNFGRNGKIYVRDSYLNGDYSKEFIASYLIHEAAHAVYYQDHNITNKNQLTHEFQKGKNHNGFYRQFQYIVKYGGKAKDKELIKVNTVYKSYKRNPDIPEGMAIEYMVREMLGKEYGY